MINSIADLSWLVATGKRDFSDEGQVKVVEHEGMLLFAYDHECNQKPPAEWNVFERMSRGLILDSFSGEIIARPFDKFWNIGQIFPEKGDEIESVTEKMDGSLGIGFRYGDEFRVATRGSFTSDQAIWATNFLKERNLSSKLVYPHETLLFEIIYPENRVVIDYEGLETLVLIGCRNKHTGKEYDFYQLRALSAVLGLPVPKNYYGLSLEAVAAKAAELGPNEEGFVIRYKSGLRLKVKGQEYLRIHKFVSNFNLKAVAQAIYDGRLEEVSAVCPDNYVDQLIQYTIEVNQRVGFLTGRAEMAHLVCHSNSRMFEDDERLYKKRYAETVLGSYKDISSYVFALRDGGDIRPMIFKREWGVSV